MKTPGFRKRATSENVRGRGMPCLMIARLRLRRLATAGRSGANNRTEPGQPPCSRCRLSQRAQGRSSVCAITAFASDERFGGTNAVVHESILPLSGPPDRLLLQKL
jgi:hypothetical protein